MSTYSMKKKRKQRNENQKYEDFTVHNRNVMEVYVEFYSDFHKIEPLRLSKYDCLRLYNIWS